MNTALFELIDRDYNGLIAYGLSEQEIISTGIPQLDMITGGGIPKGRIVEIHGAEDSGKTALALHLARQLPGPMLYVDADHGLSPYILNGAEGYLLEAGTMENTLGTAVRRLHSRSAKRGFRRYCNRHHGRSAHQRGYEEPIYWWMLGAV